MKKQFTIVTLLLASSMNQTSFTMEKKDPGCWGWLTHKANNNDYQEIPLEKSHKAEDLTPIQCYCNLTLTATEALKETIKFGEMADLVEIVYHAKNKDNIQAHDLGKFIFNTAPQNKNHILASLIVARIGKYHEKMEASNTPHLTRIQLKLNASYSRDNKESERRINRHQAKNALNILNLANSTFPTNPDEQNDILAMDLGTLVQNIYPNSYMAKILYENSKSTEKPRTRNKIILKFKR